MTTVAILEGMDYNSNEVDLLGWPKLLRPSTYKKAIRKVTRPIKRFTRPITRPLDRVLKRIPVVRTAYRASITTQYALRGKFRKVVGAAKRTWRSAKKDFAGASKGLTNLAIKVVRPMAKSGMSKGAAKITAIPLVAAKAGAMFGPWAIPLAAGAVGKAISIVWRKIKRVATRTVTNLSRSGLKKIGRSIGGGTPLAQKMSFVPEIRPKPAVIIPGIAQPTSIKAAPKVGGLAIVALLAPLALFLA